MRLLDKFDIRPTSPPRKVARWLKQGGGKPTHLMARPPEKIKMAHLHPRRLRRSA